MRELKVFLVFAVGLSQRQTVKKDFVSRVFISKGEENFEKWME